MNFFVEKDLHLDQVMPLIRERLAEGQSVKFSPRGVSMLPMLRQGKDSVELSPLPERLKKYDLPLYQRTNGQYVMHRIVGVEGTYTCMGDNQFVKEPGLEHSQMIALVKVFYRGEKKWSVDSVRYKIYCRLWYHSREIRRFWRRGINFLRRKLHMN